MCGPSYGLWDRVVWCCPAGQAASERYGANLACANVAQEVEDWEWDAEGWSEEEATELGEQGRDEGEAEEEAEEVGVEEDFAPVAAVADVCFLLKVFSECLS